MTRVLHFGLALTFSTVAFVASAQSQSTNPWAVPQAPMAIPGQIIASTSGALSQNFYATPGTGLIVQQPSSGLTAGSGALAPSRIPLGDYPPLNGLAMPVPALPPMPDQASPYGSGYMAPPQVRPMAPPVARGMGQQIPQPLYGLQPQIGQAYAYAPYGAAPYGIMPGYGGGLPAYGAMPGYGGLGGAFPGGMFPGTSGMFGGPFGGANITPWGMMSPWGW